MVFDADHVTTDVELSPEGWERLHRLRLVGMDDQLEIAGTEELIAAGLAASRGSFVAISESGRAAHAGWARLAPGTEAEAAARAAYDRFLPIDLKLKQLTSEWQLHSGQARPGTPYDPSTWNLVDRLKALDERAGPMVRRLGAVAPRWSGYRRRLSTALAKLEGGEREWWSGLRCDSYHLVWWQLHEDLLVALGIPRSDDPNQ
jgi:hypothetical protein